MRKSAPPSAFWKDEPCQYCNGPIHEKKTGLSRKVKGKHILIENVPTGVCTECGTRYYSANVLKTIPARRDATAGCRKATRELRGPVYFL